MEKHYQATKLRVDDIQDSGEIWGYASVFNKLIPSYNEIMEPGSFKKTLDENQGNVSILYMHDDGFFTGRPPIGVGQSATEDVHGLAIHGKLHIAEHQIAKEAWAMVRGFKEVGKPVGLSIGFIPIKETIDEDAVRRIKEVSLKEYSITPPDWQAAPGAGVTDARSLYMRQMNDTLIALLTELGVSMPELDKYSAGRGTTSTDTASALEPGDTTQAATDTAESLLLHSLKDSLLAATERMRAK